MTAERSSGVKQIRAHVNPMECTRQCGRGSQPVSALSPDSAVSAFGRASVGLATLGWRADLGLNLTSNRPRKRELVDEMNRVVPWADLAAPVTHLLEKRKLAAQILASINNGMLRGKGSMQRACTVVDATLIAAPSSTKGAGGQREPEMQSGHWRPTAMADLRRLRPQISTPGERPVGAGRSLRYRAPWA